MKLVGYRAPDTWLLAPDDETERVGILVNRTTREATEVPWQGALARGYWTDPPADAPSPEDLLADIAITKAPPEPADGNPDAA